LIDSCLKVFHIATQDTSKVVAINHIVEVSFDDNLWPKYNNWLYHFLEGKLKLQHSNIITKRLKTYLGKALNNRGYYYAIKGDIPKALDYYHKSLAIKEELGDLKGVALSYNNIGVNYDDQGNISKALDYYFKSLAIREEIDDKLGIAVSYNNIGSLYKGQGELLKALDYFHKSLTIREEIDDKSRIANSLNNIAGVYLKQGDLLKTLDYLNKSSVIREEIGDKRGIAESYNNIAYIYYKQGGSSKALDYFYKSLAIREEIGDKRGMATNFVNIGNIELEYGSIKQAKKNGLKSLKFSQELGSPEKIKDAAILLSKVYEKQEKWIEALKMYKLFIVMRDSINNESTQKASAQQNAKYEYKKQKAIDDLKNQQLLTTEKEEKEKQRFVLYGVGIILILVIAFAGFVFNRFKVTQKQKLEIEETNSELNTANDNYQTLLIESNHRIKNNLQMILSMLELKAINSGKQSDQLNKITGNIKAISTLHKHLSLDVHNPQVDLVKYLSEIVCL
jgi:tetratricopeptide (TPR) repeat protein